MYEALGIFHDMQNQYPYLSPEDISRLRKTNKEVQDVTLCGLDVTKPNTHCVSFPFSSSPYAVYTIDLSSKCVLDASLLCVLHEFSKKPYLTGDVWRNKGSVWKETYRRNREQIHTELRDQLGGSECFETSLVDLITKKLNNSNFMEKRTPSYCDSPDKMHIVRNKWDPVSLQMYKPIKLTSTEVHSLDIPVLKAGDYVKIDKDPWYIIMVTLYGPINSNDRKVSIVHTDKFIEKDEVHKIGCVLKIVNSVRYVGRTGQSLFTFQTLVLSNVFEVIQFLEIPNFFREHVDAQNVLLFLISHIQLIPKLKEISIAKYPSSSQQEEQMEDLQQQFETEMTRKNIRVKWL